MNFDKPIGEQLPTLDSMKSSVLETGNQLTSSIADIKQSTTSTLGEFSSQSVVSGSQEFLNSNGLIAKFAFLIFVLIIFMFLVKIGIQVLGYLMAPSVNPYLVYGMIPGNQAQVITQDPSNKNSISILKSNDQSTGIEFTWSVWLLVTNTTILKSNITTNDKYHHIFNKGSSEYDTYGIASVNNAPGLYIKTDADSLILSVAMDDIKSNVKSISAGNYSNITDISGVPLNKWFHVALRMENLILDIYINGSIVQRNAMTDIPNQNYNDVNVCQNGGFSGNLSNLQYLPRALTAFEINNIVMYGPNTTASSLVSGQNSTNYPYYMSSTWLQQYL